MDIIEAKTALEGFCVDNGFDKPKYMFVSKTDDLRRIYTMKVKIGDIIQSSGSGMSRRVAEYRAALNALNELKYTPDQTNHAKPSQSREDSSSEHSSNNESTISDTTRSNNRSQDTEISAQTESGSTTAAANEDNITTSNITTNNTHNNSITVRTNGMNGDIIVAQTEKEEENSAKKWHPIPVLQQFCLQNKLSLPFYDNHLTEGPPQSPTYWCKCRIEITTNGETPIIIGIGKGSSLAMAKRNAADDVIKQIRSKNISLEI